MYSETPQIWTLHSPKSTSKIWTVQAVPMVSRGKVFMGHVHTTFVINCFSKNCVILETDPTGEEKMDTATDEVNSGEGGGGDREETKDKYD